MKKPLRNLLTKQSKETFMRGSLSFGHELDMVQKALETDPSSIVLREEEASYLETFFKLF